MKGKIEELRNGGVIGFIRGTDGKKYFYHISKAEAKGWNKRDLKKGMELEFTTERTPKGLRVKMFITEKTASATQKPPIRPAKAYSTQRSLHKYDDPNRNFYLFLNKPYYVTEHSKMFAKKENGSQGFALGNRFSKDNKFADLTGFKFSGIDCAAITQRQRESVAALYAQSEPLNFRPDWRLTLGLGGASVFETDLSLHHIYGVPYIPASSIKGVVRSYIIETAFDNREELAVKNLNFCDLFGCAKEHEIYVRAADGKLQKEKVLSWYGEQHAAKESPFAERRGKIYFFDALPTDSQNIHISMDIMNVHYKDYYDSPQEKDGSYREENMRSPADWTNPNIVNFLTVKDTSFQFLLAAKDDSLNGLQLEEKNIIQWLTEALESHGIGAKTAVGYGYLQSD